MADTFREVTQVGCLSRLVESIKGVVIGFLLIAVSVVVLFWGEGRAVHRAQALAEGKANVISVQAAQVDPANEGKLIHLSGEGASKAGVEDAEFGVAAPTALRLHRNVEMYQWKQKERTEKHSNLGGSEERVTTYTYQKVWSGTKIDSANFKQSGHSNPAEIPVAAKKWNADDATLGAFTLNAVVLDQLPMDKTLTPPATALETAGKMDIAKKKPVISQEMIYFGDPAAPEIGDMRVGYRHLPPGPLSVVAKQVQNSFEPYPAEAGEVLLAQVGTFSAEVMFKQAEEENANITWIIRGVGFIVIWVGFAMMFGPLVVVADVIPLIGSIVGAGTFLASLLCALPVWLITVAVAWVVYRPLLGAGLLVLGIGIPIIFMLTRKPAPKATATV